MKHPSPLELQTRIDSFLDRKSREFPEVFSER